MFIVILSLILNPLMFDTKNSYCNLFKYLKNGKDLLKLLEIKIIKYGTHITNDRY